MPKWIGFIVAGACAVVVGGLVTYFAIQAHLGIGAPTAPSTISDGRR